MNSIDDLDRKHSIDIINSFINNKSHDIDEKKCSILDKAIKDIARCSFENINESRREEVRTVLRGFVNRSKEEEDDYFTHRGGYLPDNSKKISILTLHSLSDQAKFILEDLDHFDPSARSAQAQKARLIMTKVAHAVQSQNAVIFDKEEKIIEEEVVLWTNFLNAKEQKVKRMKALASPSQKKVKRNFNAVIEQNEKVVENILIYKKFLIRFYHQILLGELSPGKEKLLTEITLELRDFANEVNEYFSKILVDAREKVEKNGRKFLDTPPDPPKNFYKNFEDFLSSTNQLMFLKQSVRNINPEIDYGREEAISSRMDAVEGRMQDLLQAQKMHQQKIENSVENISFTDSLIKECLSYVKTIAVTKMQKTFRRSQVRKKLKKISQEQVIQQKEIGQRYVAKINPRVREPLTDLEKNDEWISPNDIHLAQAQKAIVKSTKVGSYKNFVRSLRLAFSDTLQSIYESPPNQRDYIILADRADKSTNWVVSHLHDMMSIHPPTDILPREELTRYLQTHPKVKHIVMLDDGVYSGTQAAYYIKQLLLPHFNYQLHVTIPYMTTAGKNKILEALQKKNCKFHIHDVELMLSYDELIKRRKIFSYTGKVKINTAKIKSIKKLSNDDDNSLVRLKINQKLENLQEMVRIGGNENDQYEKILEIIFLAEAHLNELGNEGTQLTQSLFKTMHMERDIEQEERLIKSYIDDRQGYEGTYTMKTPSWFAHKGTDNFSADVREMEMIVGNIPIEPYKRDKKIIDQRRELIRKLKSEMPHRTLEETVLQEEQYSWLKDRLDFVETNRGFFLLGNSYVEETNASHLRLYVNKKVINLGGNEGEYQYKLKKGDVFKLEDPQSGKTITLRLYGGIGEACLGIVESEHE